MTFVSEVTAASYNSDLAYAYIGRKHRGLGCFFFLTRTTLKEPYFSVLPCTYVLPQFYLQSCRKLLWPTEYFLADLILGNVAS